MYRVPAASEVVECHRFPSASSSPARCRPSVSIAVTSVIFASSSLTLTSRGLSGSAFSPSAGPLNEIRSAASWGLSDSGSLSGPPQAVAPATRVTTSRVQLTTVWMRGVWFMNPR